MIIHFVCTGNAYRSRLAEAYVNSKNLEEISAISSGIAPDTYMSWLAIRIIQKKNLAKPASAFCQHTTDELLKKGDFTVFMEDHHYDYAKNLGFNSDKYEIWDIPDLPPGIDDNERIKITEETFEKIKTKTDDLLKRLPTD